MAMSVSSTVVAVSAPDEKVYKAVAAGVNRYQTLRDGSVAQDGPGGSPAVVASLRAAITLDIQGNGPPGEITSAPAQVSLAGGAAAKPQVAPQQRTKLRRPQKAPEPGGFGSAI